MSLYFSPQIDPIIFSIGPVALRWYALMYIIALGLAVLLGSYRAKKPNSSWTPAQVGDIAFYLFLGAVLGGRIGYTLFYDFGNFIDNPASIIGWTGSTIEWSGMSFHGGLIGVVIASFLIAKRYKKTFWEFTDFIAPLVPLGLFFGRLGNFINGELWGRFTDQTWGFFFEFAPTTVDFIYRHPSQLYEAFTEGLLLFIILWIYTAKPRPKGAASGIFLLGYGGFRFIVEFFREPDAHLGYIAGGWLTQGMLLCIPMILIGLIILITAYRRKSS